MSGIGKTAFLNPAGVGASILGIKDPLSSAMGLNKRPGAAASPPAAALEAPTINNPAVQAAGEAARANAAAAFTRYTTILSSAAGDTSAAPAVKKTLLGGIT